MKRYMLLLAVLLPVISVAQVNDIYFVPTKEKKVVVVKNSDANAFADIDDCYATGEPESVDTVEIETETLYYTNDLYDLYYGDYGYTSRIVRFRSPGRLMGSSLYWDLRYNSGINDWLVYDNGYTIDIYPTSNNPFYYYGGCGIGFYNPSSWYVHYNTFTPYWAWRPSWYWHDYHWHTPYWHNPHWYHPHWYAGHHAPHYGHNSLLRPKHRVHTDVPVNGATVKGGRDNVSAPSDGETRGGNDRGGTSVRTQHPRRTVNNAGVTNDVSTSRDDRGGAAPRREASGNSNNDNKKETPAAVRQQPKRGASGTNVRESGSSSDERGSNAVRRSGSTSSSSRGGNSGNSRSVSGSSGSRSGSTGVSRSSGTSGGSYSRGGSSSGSSSGSSGGSRGGSGTRR